MMAANDWLSLLEKNPNDVWKGIGAVDPIVKAKEKLSDGIKNCIKLIQAKEDNPARGWFSTKGNMARVTLRVGTKILPINGNEYNVVPKERLLDFYKGALDAVSKEALDGDIRDLLKPDPIKVGLFMSNKRADAGKPRAPWTPERRAKQAASIAARNAKKA